MDLKIGILAIILVSIPSIESFTVHPLHNVSISEEWETASFPYVIHPWPPDYRNSSGHVKYEHVELSFWNETQGRPGTELCRVVYMYGVLDENTGNCSLWDERMNAFEPATTKFSFEETQFDTDRGNYRLLIEYGAPDVSSVTVLDVHVFPWAPNITQKPEEPAYRENDRVELICNISNANPPAQLEWTLGLYQPISPDYYYKAVDYFDTSTSIIVQHVRKADHGQAYICWAFQDDQPSEKISSSTTIYVEYPPEISLRPCVGETDRYYVIEGYNAIFTCEIDANPDVDSTYWTKSYNGLDFEHIPGLDRNETEVIEWSVLRNESAVYSCTSVNSVGPGNVAQCAMDVQYGPTVSTPAEVSVKEGESVYIHCTAQSNPDPDTYRWKKQGDSSFLQDGPRLNMSVTEAGDTGMYLCEVTNTLTPTGSSHVRMTGTSTTQLHVLYSARLYPYALTKFTGYNDQPAVVRCDVHGYPALDFRWTLNGRSISSDSQRNITQDSGGAVVHIYRVRDEDFGVYECQASNTQGTVITELQLLRPGKPDAPQKCTVHNVTDHYTTLMCIPGYDGGESLSTYVEASHEEGGKRWSVPSSVSWQTGEQSMVVRVEGLEPVTEYVLHVYGNNVHDRSDGYLRVNVTTMDGPGSPHRGDTGPSVGLIVGVTLSVLFLLMILVAVILLVVWRVGLEPACARTAQEKAQMPYTTLALRKAVPEEEGEDDTGFLNEAYIKDLNESGSARENEYVPMPGVRRDEAVNRRSDMTTSDNRANEAYEMRRKQAQLAGMGALSHSSHQNLTYSNLPQGPDVRPKTTSRPLSERPPTLGAPAEWDEWEIQRATVSLKEKLGEGAFGEVWKGTAMDINGPVAIKVLQENSPVEERRALTKELALMKTLKRHPNIIRLLGCCSMEDPLLIVLEFAELGNLQEYLRESRADGTYSSLDHVSETLTAHDLTKYALDVATGMEYISSLNYLHRDLAARNVLLTSDMVCKVCDFGLARDVINNRQYESKSQRRLPIRWMAPESLFDSIYTTKSDVWAFGVLLWEIVTLGSTPYLGMTGVQIMDLLRTGYRMDRPRHCSRNMYELMRECWQHTSSQRPSFRVLRGRLTGLLQEFTQNPSSNLAVESMQANCFTVLRNPPGEKC